MERAILTHSGSGLLAAGEVLRGGSSRRSACRCEASSSAFKSQTSAKINLRPNVRTGHHGQALLDSFMSRSFSFKEECMGCAVGVSRRMKALQPIRAAQYDAGEDSELTFLERLVKAWAILFPPKLPDLSNAEIARERLRLVLFSDRGEVSPEIRHKLRENILKAISTYVEIAAEEEIGFNVTTDPDIGTVYSVTVPVRRVKPEYQEAWGEGGFRDRLWTDQAGQDLDNTFGSSRPKFRFETQVVREDSEGSA